MLSDSKDTHEAASIVNQHTEIYAINLTIYEHDIITAVFILGCRINSSVDIYNAGEIGIMERTGPYGTSLIFCTDNLSPV